MRNRIAKQEFFFQSGAFRFGLLEATRETVSRTGATVILGVSLKFERNRLPADSEK